MVISPNNYGICCEEKLLVGPMRAESVQHTMHAPYLKDVRTTHELSMDYLTAR
jgi:hypothetical protein